LIVLGWSMVTVGVLFYVGGLFHGCVAIILVVGGGALIVRTLRGMWPY
jgi:hypothetical protein